MKPRTYIEYVLDETYKFNLQSSIFNKIYNFLIDQSKKKTQGKVLWKRKGQSQQKILEKFKLW
jgi:hypothetical protein